jgi:oligopeptide/dipeptide ABC transporter ATP-binding protein
MDPHLQVRDLVKHFPVRGSRSVVQAVSGVTLSLDPGATLGLVGESGSGKTTIGRCVLRLTEPTSGRILFKGVDLLRLKEGAFRVLRPKMQMVFQEAYGSLHPTMTVGKIVAEPLQLWSRLKGDGLRARVEELLHLVDLDLEHVHSYPHQLSGGQQQKVGIARALANNPELIVLDECTSSLDPMARAQIIDLLIDLQKRLGLSYLFISHDLTTVRYISQHVAVMYLGKIVEQGRTKEIFTRPRHPYTRALLGSVFEADPAKRRDVTVLQGEIPSPINLPQGCYFYSRCPIAKPECQRAFPPLQEMGGAHLVACYRANEPVCADSPATTTHSDVRPPFSPIAPAGTSAQGPS